MEVQIMRGVVISAYFIGVASCIFGGGIVVGKLIIGALEVWWSLYKMIATCSKLRRGIKDLQKDYDEKIIVRDKKLREEVAALAHDQWSGWIQYMIGVSLPNKDGTLIISKRLVERWTRQVKTKYSDLSEDEKDSDRREADKFLKLLKQ